MNPNRPDEFHDSPRRIIVEKDVSRAIVGGFFEVYNELGYGLVESLYGRALEIALRARGLSVEREFPIIVKFRGEEIGFQRLDMIVERRVVVELKSTERLPDSAKRQLRSYVSSLELDLGILLHFGPLPRFYRVLAGWRPTRDSTMKPIRTE